MNKKITLLKEFIDLPEEKIKKADDFPVALLLNLDKRIRRLERQVFFNKLVNEKEKDEIYNDVTHISYNAMIDTLNTYSLELNRFFRERSREIFKIGKFSIRWGLGTSLGTVKLNGVKKIEEKT